MATTRQPDRAEVTDPASKQFALGRPRRPVLTYGTYPVLAVAQITVIVATLTQGWDRGPVAGLFGLAIIVACVLLEWRYPLRPEWRMTKRSFFRRDAPFLFSGLAIEQAAAAGGVVLATRFLPSQGAGLLAAAPLVMQVIVGLVAFELAWYGYHRLAHRGGRLWRVHGAHHSPAQLYVFMHGVFHPLDVVVVRLLTTLIIFTAIGASSDAAFIAIMVMGLQATISHLNADLRLGPLNRLLVGPETHRYHHAAEYDGNYGTVTTLWDQLFGTFIYTPTHIPARLGLQDPTTYPNPERFTQVMLWPLRSQTQPTTPETAP